VHRYAPCISSRHQSPTHVKRTTPTAIFSDQNLIDMPNTNAVRGLRGTKYEKIPGKYDLKSGENGHLPRANGAAGGLYCSPALPSVCGRQFEPLAGWGGGFGTRICTSAAAVARGALLQIECLRKTQGTQAVRPTRCRKAMRGVFGLCIAPLFPGGPGGTKPLLFTTHRPSQMCKKKAVVVHVTRW
jgi:hypothetical protein